MWFLSFFGDGWLCFMIIVVIFEWVLVIFVSFWLIIHRRGISRFYNGKSKSFASLRDASSSTSIKEIAKTENAYARKRRNLLATNLAWEKTRGSPLKGNGGGILKRVASKTTLALAVAMSNAESKCNSPSGSSSPRKEDFSSLRSFSLADLQHCAGVNLNSNSNGMALKPPG